MARTCFLPPHGLRPTQPRICSDMRQGRGCGLEVDEEDPCRPFLVSPGESPRSDAPDSESLPRDADQTPCSPLALSRRSRAQVRVAALAQLAAAACGCLAVACFHTGTWPSAANWRGVTNLSSVPSQKSEQEGNPVIGRPVNADLRSATNLPPRPGREQADTLEMLAKAMRPYRATPWYKMEPKAGGDNTYGPADYRDFPVDEWSQDRKKGKVTFKNAHAGDLLEHSKWTSLQLALWLHSGDEWTKDLNGYVVILAGFLHDLGKAGDCAFNCIAWHDKQTPHMIEYTANSDRAWRKGEHCYLDVYSPCKYERQDDKEHPVYSANYLQSEADDFKFWLQCPTEKEMKVMWHSPSTVGKIRHAAKYRDDYFIVTSHLLQWKDARLGLSSAEPDGVDDSEPLYLRPKEILGSFGLSPMDSYKAMVVARMHWDLGRLNMRPDDPGYMDADAYLQKLAAVINKFAECGDDFRGPDCVAGPEGNALYECRHNKENTLDVLKMCIAVGAADISGASPSRVSLETRRAVEIVSDEDNGALRLCKRIDQLNAPSSSEVYEGLDQKAWELAGLICAAGCIAKGDGSTNKADCALTQRYPAQDPWTAYGFEAKGYGYRTQLLLRFGEISASDESYNAWCDTDMASLAEMPKIEISALITDGMDVLADRTMYIQTLPLTGREISSCRRETRYGFIEGACFQVGQDKCSKHDSALKIPCSPTHNVTLPMSTRKQLAIPEQATSMAFIYNSGSNQAFHLGGFIYLDDDGRVAGIHYLVGELKAEDKTRPVSFAKPHEPSAETYNMLRSALRAGVAMTGYQQELEPELANKVSRYAWAMTPEMPDGGFVYMTKTL